jgi:hypothetical protein
MDPPSTTATGSPAVAGTAIGKGGMVEGISGSGPKNQLSVKKIESLRFRQPSYLPISLAPVNGALIDFEFGD